MRLEIVKCGHPVLREKGRPVTEVTPAIRQLAVDMLETMHAANGVGLAAPQVAQSLLLTVIDVRQSEQPSTLTLNGQPQEPESQMPLVLLNPVVTESDGAELGEEGCLSVPEVCAPIQRAARVKVRAENLEGDKLDIEATGLLARALQHEIDHLNGILFLDRMDAATRASFDGRIKKMVKETRAALKQTTRQSPVPARIL